MQVSEAFYAGFVRLKTLCVGAAFASQDAAPGTFPHSVLCHTADFTFFVETAYERALQIVRQNRDIDLVFLDADTVALSEITLFLAHIKDVRPNLPLVVFTHSSDDRMRLLMREGADWHFTKQSPTLNRLAEQIHWYVYAPTKWDDLFNQYQNEAIKPRLEPGLSYSDLDGLNSNPEERFIIKRLFAGSDVVQIFRMDQGFSGSRIYTVKPEHQLKRILKIDSADRLEAVRQKQEKLILPRLNRRVGQIQGKLVRGQHLAGACYTLAGSTHDAITLTKFLQDHNLVRKELIDKVLQQLRVSLEQLYAGSSDTELRYWAPLYARILPPCLTLEAARLVVDSSPEETSPEVLQLAADELTTLSAVPSHPVLRTLNEQVRQGKRPLLQLRGFEIAEIDTQEGVLYLHDDLVARFPLSPLLNDKNHPILRFKVQFTASERHMLTHPVFRRGKRITVQGEVAATQETVLANNIAAVTQRPFDFDADTFELAAGRYMSPIANMRHLLWEIGREDMIMPLPQIAPVVHGDLNTSNILVEVNDDIPVWLIDFSDARAGHTYFDLAKLEVEFRTHVFYHLFEEMVAEGIWDVETATQFALLVENCLLEAGNRPFRQCVAALREYQPDWYDALYTHFPLYSENLLYFLHSLRQIAANASPERYRHHFPVAVFFHSMMVLKFEGLDHSQWPKRLALCSALVAGKQAVQVGERPLEVTQMLGKLRQQSAFALATIGNGDKRKYLLQWNDNWGMYNLIGGKLDNDKGDKASFARTIQRELNEELGLRSHKDYRIVKEFKPLLTRQFSRRQNVFKDYEFRVFQIELLPRHPMSPEEFDFFAQRLSPERENILVSRAEIERLRTLDNRPISETTRMVLQELGEIAPVAAQARFTPLDFVLSSANIVVSRGHAQVNGRLQNPSFSTRIENITVEVLPSPGFETRKDSAYLQVGSLEPGEDVLLTLWLQPRDKEGDLNLRITFYDVRGHEFRQLIEAKLTFTAPMRSLLHLDNPYVVGKPLTPASESLYVGREDVFVWIEENLLGKTQPHTLILYGQRRMGKTSTLYQLVGGERGRAIREYPDTPIYPVYIDLQRFAGCDMQHFFGRLAQQITQGLARRQVTVPLPSSWSSNGTLFADFDSFLDSVERQLPPRGLLVLIIDELEQLQESVAQGRLPEEIFPYLRSLMQHRARMTFILTGTSQLMEAYWRTIFHVGINREIQPLTRQETELLIREPVAPMVQYDELAVERIWAATQGHPYFSQLICHRLVSASNLAGGRNRVITIADVRQTVEQVVMEDDSHLQHLWNESSRSERWLLANVANYHAQGQTAVSRNILSSNMPGDVTGDALNEALLRLTGRGLLRRVAAAPQADLSLFAQSADFAVELSFGLMTQWLCTKHPLGLLIG